MPDEHDRWAAYRSMIAALADDRSGDRALVAAFLRDPVDLVAKSAIVELVDTVAMRATDPATFRRWAADLAPELDRLAEGHREFVLRRVEDWSLYLAIETGHTPTTTELNAATNFMQRRLAERSMSRPTLTALGEMGRTRKIRNIAKNRRDVR